MKMSVQKEKKRFIKPKMHLKSKETILKIIPNGYSGNNNDKLNNNNKNNKSFIKENKINRPPKKFILLNSNPTYPNIKRIDTNNFLDEIKRRKKEIFSFNEEKEKKKIEENSRIEESKKIIFNIKHFDFLFPKREYESEKLNLTEINPTYNLMKNLEKEKKEETLIHCRNVSEVNLSAIYGPSISQNLNNSYFNSFRINSHLLDNNNSYIDSDYERPSSQRHNNFLSHYTNFSDNKRNKTVGVRNNIYSNNVSYYSNYNNISTSSYAFNNNSLNESYTSSISYISKGGKPFTLNNFYFISNDDDFEKNNIKIFSEEHVESFKNWKISNETKLLWPDVLHHFERMKIYEKYEINDEIDINNHSIESEKNIFKEDEISIIKEIEFKIPFEEHYTEKRLETLNSEVNEIRLDINDEESSIKPKNEIKENLNELIETNQSLFFGVEIEKNNFDYQKIGSSGTFNFRLSIMDIKNSNDLIEENELKFNEENEKNNDFTSFGRNDNGIEVDKPDKELNNLRSNLEHLISESNQENINNIENNKDKNNINDNDKKINSDEELNDWLDLSSDESDENYPNFIKYISDNNKDIIRSDLIELLNIIEVENFSELKKRIYILLYHQPPNQEKFIDLIFERGIKEFFFQPLYAKLCKELDKTLANKKDKAKTPLRIRIIDNTKKYFKNLKNTIEDRNQTIGIISFIGELINIQMVSKKAGIQCMRNIIEELNNISNKISHKVYEIYIEGLIIMLNIFATACRYYQKDRIREDDMSILNNEIKKVLDFLIRIQNEDNFNKINPILKYKVINVIEKSKRKWIPYIFEIEKQIPIQNIKNEIIPEDINTSLSNNMSIASIEIKSPIAKISKSNINESDESKNSINRGLYSSKNKNKIPRKVKSIEKIIPSEIIYNDLLKFEKYISNGNDPNTYVWEDIERKNKKKKMSFMKVLEAYIQASKKFLNEQKEKYFIDEYIRIILDYYCHYIRNESIIENIMKKIADIPYDYNHQENKFLYDVWESIIFYLIENKVLVMKDFNRFCRFRDINYKKNMLILLDDVANFDNEKRKFYLRELRNIKFVKENLDIAPEDLIPKMSSKI